MCINNFHWILLCIEINRVRAMVFDSLRKPKEDYQDLIHVLVHESFRNMMHPEGGPEFVLEDYMVSR